MNVIEVENLYKQYRLGQVSTGSIAHDLNRWWHAVRGKEDPYEKITGLNNRDEALSSDYVWALQDINFSVKQGEVLGIIGRNGAGKSTLLKILSKVTSPTKGNIKVKGRIASLLEVGTGFHPELTGRENIFLNGAILGMTKAEIRSKFDEIVAFSGVEKYIDTPVKRYSSGMYVRLAFAVAAHLEPEILIVDEVLAVGDAEFQNKCLGKMKDVSGEGRTVLFVSHNMAAVKSLCSKGLLVSKGKIELHSDILSVVKKYEDLEELEYCYEYYGNKQIKSIVIKSSENKIYFNSSIEFQLTFKVLTPIRNAICGFVIKDNHHMNIVTVNNKHYNQELLHESLVSNGTFTIKIKKLNLIPGSYTIDFFLGDGIKDICKIENRIKIEVLSSINETIINKLNKSENKLFIPEITWKLENTF